MPRPNSGQPAAPRDGTFSVGGRRCQACGKPLVRKRGEAPRMFALRTACDAACNAAARLPVGMTDAARLSLVLVELELGPRAAARQLGIDPRRVQRWLAGTAAVSPWVWHELGAELARRWAGGDD
jgi:transposase-like protein